MKCHFIFDEICGEVLIPGCWSVVISQDISDCNCDTDTFTEFEKKKYNLVLSEKVKIIKDLERENLRLNKKIKTLLIKKNGSN